MVISRTGITFFVDVKTDIHSYTNDTTKCWHVTSFKWLLSASFINEHGFNRTALQNIRHADENADEKDKSSDQNGWIFADILVI